MIVAEEYEVEARHLTRHFLRGILLVGGCCDASRLSRMEQSDDDICFLFLFHDLHPLLGCGDHLVETQSAPDILREPVGDGRCDHAENGDAASVALDDRVRLQVR